MFVTKKRWRIIVCLAACLLFFSHNVYAFYYIGNEVHSNTDSSNSNNSSSNNSSQSGPSNTSSPTSPSSDPSGPTGPTGPTGPSNPNDSGDNSNTDSPAADETPAEPAQPPAIVYPDPTEAMSDTQLNEILQSGTEEQKKSAEKIIQKHEHIRQNDKLVEKNNEIEADVDEAVAKEAETPKAPAEKTVEKETEKEIEESRKELNEKINSNADTLVKNVKKTQKVKETSNSKKEGDPVKIAEGAYEQCEEDFQFTGAIDFSIKRRYSSTNHIVSSFGYGWTTNLDERMIHGITVDYEQYNRNLINSSNQIKKAVEDYEKQLADYYGDSDLLKIKEMYYDRIEELKKEVADAKKLIERSKNLLAQAQGYEAVEEIEAVKTKTENLIVNLNGKISDYERAIKDVSKHYDEFSYCRREYEYSLDRIQNFRGCYEASISRRAANKKTMFKGTPFSYEEISLDCLTLIDEDGYPNIFQATWDGSRVWKTNDDKKYNDIRIIDDQFRVFHKNGIVKYFDGNGFVCKITDRNGNWILINRDASEKIISIETSDSEKLNFEYKDSFISKITNVRSPDENLAYGYKGEQLVSVKDTDDDVQLIQYDEHKRICSVQKGDGSNVRIEYGEVDADGNSITTATINEEGYSEYFIYDKGDHHTDYINHDNNRFSYWYDDKNRTIKEIHPDGSVILYQYDSDNNLIQKNTNGFVCNYVYDTRGSLLREEYPDGSFERWEYNWYGLPTLYVDRDGITEEYIRDSKGNLLELKRGGVTLAAQEFYPDGLLKRSIRYGQNAVSTDYEYDEHGNLSSETTAGIKTEYIYDSRNRIVRIIKAGKVISEYKYEKGKIEQKDYNGLTTEYYLNACKEISKIIYRDTILNKSNVVHIEYDKRQLPLKIYAGDSNSEELIKSCLYSPEGKLKGEILHGKLSWIRLYKYSGERTSEIRQFMTEENLKGNNIDLNYLEALADSCGENVWLQKYNFTILGNNESGIEVIDGEGIRNTFNFDSSGNLIKKINGIGEEFQFAFTRAGRKRQEQSRNGGWYQYVYNQSGYLTDYGEKDSVAIKREYYPDGSIKCIKDRCGKETSYQYDEMGRLKGVLSNQRKVWYQYDEFSRITKLIVGETPDERSAVYYETYEYSEDNRTILKIEGGKYKRTYIYDGFGNIIKTIDGNTNERSFVYNSQNQLVESYDGYGNVKTYRYNALGKISDLILPDGTQTHYEYNYQGLLNKITDECGILYKAEYDKSGLIKRIYNRADAEKVFEYDKSGRLTKILEGGQVVEARRYESYGRSINVKDGNDHDYLYNFDSFGRIINERNRIGFEQNYTYDGEGRLLNKSDFNGAISFIIYPEHDLSYLQHYSDGSENAFVYDENGNLIKIENADGKSVFSYDQGGRLILQLDSDTGEKIYFDYDEAGNRIALECNNRKTSYAYGKNNELKEIFDSRQKSGIKLSYDKNGREVLRKFENGVKEETQYDRAGRISIKDVKSDRGELLWAEGYVYDEKGKISASVDLFGRVTIYEYNKRGQLSTVFYPYTDEMCEKIRKEAELNGLPVDVEVGENRFLSSKEKSALIQLMNSIQYGSGYNLPNLHTFIKVVYSYDNNVNCITKKTKLGTIEYTYNEENHLISSGSRGKPYVNYTYDPNGNLLTEENNSFSKKYSYNVQNRLSYSEISDKKENNYMQTAYAYDALGRRVITCDSGLPGLRTIYEGLSFDVIKQIPISEKGLFINNSASVNQWGKAGRPNGGRYRYLDDENMNDESRYYYLDDGFQKRKNKRLIDERTVVSIAGRPVAQSTSEEFCYFTSDLKGSITCVTDRYGSSKASYSYDAYGSLVEGSFTGSMDYGYLGKQYDEMTGLYNYGYRDYSPENARFTTSDPVRDGFNWFSYCNGDPVNFIDLWGLCVNEKVKIFVYRNKKSYEISRDRKNPKNDSLDVILLYNTETKEYVVLENVQTVANYPSTDGNDQEVDSCFMDTIGTSNFKLKVYKKTNVAEGDAGVITETETIDGRDVDKNGFTEDALSDGRGLIHSDEIPDKDGETYKTKFSKQCFILNKDDNKLLFDTLRDWGIEDNTSIKGTVFDTERRDR